MNFFSYVVARDFGFAPNPFNGFCTLATCKPDIRNAAKVQDWVFGWGAVALGHRGRLVYAMQVSEVISYVDYFSESIYQCKKPVLHGSLKQTFGDNIYTKNATGDWIQLNSHHSNTDGTTNIHNLKRDTKSDKVLISKNYFYFGRKSIEIPNKYSLCIYNHRGFKYVDEESSKALVAYIENNYPKGLNGNPIQFNRFSRYNGIS